MPKPENIIGKGFDKRPENINRKGRPKKLVNNINDQLHKDGYSAVSQSEIKDAFLTLLNLPLSKIIQISKQDDEYPALYKLVARELTGKRGQDMLENLLDRAIGKSQQAVDVTTKGESIKPAPIEFYKTNEDK